MPNEGYETGERMAVASERYVHFLVDVTGRPPQRCRVSLGALATLEGICPANALLLQATRLFLKYRRVIESAAKMKLYAAKEPTRWITIAADDLDLAP